MPFEEKRAWVEGMVTTVSYAAYLTIVLGRAKHLPLIEVPYVPTLLWTIGAGIVAVILLSIVVGMTSPGDCGKKDERDREIHRFGEYAGQSFVAIGGLAALGMSMAELDHFWISNAIYLTFVLSSILGSAAKIVAYHRGFQSCC